MHSHNSKETSKGDFLTGSVPATVVKNTIPAVIAMIMVVVYNLADTFFISFTNNDLQMSAVSLGAPVFMIFMSLGTLFGVGGTSVISRALGKGDTLRAKKTCSFCMWMSAGIGILLSVVLWLMSDSLPKMLGADEGCMEYAKSYISITVLCGGFSMVSNCLSNLLRSEGKAMNSMLGTVIGNLLNIGLDALFVLVFDMGVTGVAIATVIGNVVSCLFYILYFIRGKSNLSIRISRFSGKESIAKEVVAIGLSASLSNLLVSFTTILVNRLLSEYDSLYVPAYGVTSKVLMIVSMIGIGIGAGVQPILGYCVGAKNKERFKAYLRYSLIYVLAVCLVIAGICFVLKEPMVDFFLTEDTSFDAGVKFTQIMLLTTWLTGAFVVLQNALQACGAAIPALISAVLRQAVIFIPAAVIMDRLFGYMGIIWAQPVADVASLIIITILVIRRIKKTTWEEN